MSCPITGDPKSNIYPKTYKLLFPYAGFSHVIINIVIRKIKFIPKLKNGFKMVFRYGPKIINTKHIKRFIIDVDNL